MLALGIDYNLCGLLDPNKLRAFVEADVIKAKHRRNENNFMAYLQGQYFMSAIAATIGNAFKKKGEKPIEYPDKPFDLEPPKELTEKQKIEQTEILFGRLQGLKEAFDKKKHAENEAMSE